MFNNQCLTVDCCCHRALWSCNQGLADKPFDHVQFDLIANLHAWLESAGEPKDIESHGLLEMECNYSIVGYCGFKMV